MLENTKEMFQNSGAPILFKTSLDVINTYFQTINTDDAYEAPTRLQIPVGTRSPNCECDVRNLLTHQKRTASGPDEFRYWLWRDYSHHLAPVITQIFNCSLKHQTVPFLWKLANVSPISKESLLTEYNQLRTNLINQHHNENFSSVLSANKNYFLSSSQKSAIGPDQFAHKRGHNTTMPSSSANIFGLSNLTGMRILSEPFSFDFSKAFDSVSHSVLCKKIVSYDINPYIKNWIMSFLCDRQQRVVVDGVTQCKADTA